MLASRTFIVKRLKKTTSDDPFDTSNKLDDGGIQNLSEKKTITVTRVPYPTHIPSGTSHICIQLSFIKE